MPAYVNMLLHEYCIILTQCIEWMNHLRLSVGETALLSKLDELGDMYLEKYSAPDITSDVMLVARNTLGADVLTPKPSWTHSDFPAVSQEMFAGVLDNINDLSKWLEEN